MKCENCGKNEVSFVYRSSINGRTEEHHLCQACAEKLGYTQKLFNRRPSMRDSFFGNDDFFGDFFSPMPSLLGRMNRMLESPFDDFFDAMPEYDVSLYANKKQKTTPESAKEALEALLPVLSDEALDFNDRDTVFDACKAKAEELGKKNGWLLYPLGIALSGKQRTPGGGTDLACMMGRETTLARVNAAIEKLNG